VGVIILVGLVNSVLFSHLPQLEVREVRVVGAQFIDKEEIRAQVEAELVRNYLHMLAASNTLLMPKKKIKEELLTTHEEIKAVTVKRDGIERLTIEIQEYKPYALYCGEKAEDITEESLCYFVNREGVIFSRAGNFSEGVYLEIRGPLLGERLREKGKADHPLGFYVIEEELFTPLVAFINVLDAMGVRLKEFVYTDNSDAEFILYNNVRIKFNIQQNFEIVLSDLDAVFESGEVSLTELTAPETPLEYIDVRFNNRVFFK
jgi:hypothetical protein